MIKKEELVWAELGDTEIQAIYTTPNHSVKMIREIKQIPKSQVNLLTKVITALKAREYLDYIAKVKTKKKT